MRGASAKATEREAYLYGLLVQSIGVIDGLAQELADMPAPGEFRWNGMTLEAIERECLRQALAMSATQKAAARLLGISARVMDYKMQIHGLSRANDSAREVA